MMPDKPITGGIQNLKLKFSILFAIN